MQGLLGAVPGFMSEQLLDEPNSCICSNISDRTEILVWESTLWEPCLRIICSLNTSLITLLLNLEEGTVLGTSDHTRITWRKTMAKIQLEIGLAECLSSHDTTTLSFDFKWSRGHATCYLQKVTYSGLCVPVPSFSTVPGPVQLAFQYSLPLLWAVI